MVGCQVEAEEHIVKANLIESLKSKLMRKFIPNKKLEDCIITVSFQKKRDY